MTPKTKPKAKKKGKLKPAKRSVSTLKRKRSKGQSIGRQSNTGVTRAKKISRQSVGRSKPTPRKQRSTAEDSTPSSGPSKTVCESQEITAFGPEMNENGTATSLTPSSDGNKKQD